jgi:hypothetical protein
LENARVLLEDPPWSDNPQKYRNTAETIILRILSFDPENKFAKRLLEKARIPVPPEPSLEPSPQPKPARMVGKDMLFVAYGNARSLTAGTADSPMA